MRALLALLGHPALQFFLKRRKLMKLPQFLVNEVILALLVLPAPLGQRFTWKRQKLTNH
jgi:hypothetical protein